jgi:hypothetical protein
MVRSSTRLGGQVNRIPMVKKTILFNQNIGLKCLIKKIILLYFFIRKAYYYIIQTQLNLEYEKAKQF